MYQIKIKDNGRIEYDEAFSHRELHALLSEYAAAGIKIVSIKRIMVRRPVLQRLMSVVVQ